MPFTEDEIREALKDVYDPELPVNIVDLGLVYRVELQPDPDAPGIMPKQKVSIDLTLTTPGCPSHAQITEHIQNRLAGIAGDQRIASESGLGTKVEPRQNQP